MTKLVLSFQQTESTMDTAADYTLEAIVTLLTNPKDSSHPEQPGVEGPMLMTHVTVALSSIVLQSLSLI